MAVVASWSTRTASLSDMGTGRSEWRSEKPESSSAQHAERMRSIAETNMTSETPHLFKRGVVAGVVLAIAATAAIASFFGSQTVADYLGTGGKTFETWGGPGAWANGVDLQHLTIN